MDAPHLKLFAVVSRCRDDLRAVAARVESAVRAREPLKMRLAVMLNGPTIESSHAMR